MSRSRRTGSRGIPALSVVVSGLVLLGGAAAQARTVPADVPPKQIVKQIPQLPFKPRVQPRGTYVASVGRPSRVFVALVVQRGRLAVYVCDGRRVSDWFGGRVAGGRFDLRSRKGTRIHGVVGRTIRGRIALRGARLRPYVAIRARGAAGLYLGRDTRLRGVYKYRWIRIGNSVRGLSEDGGGSVKNGVAVTEPGGTNTSVVGSPGGSGTGGGSGSQPAPFTTCAEFTEEINRLRAQASDLEKKPKTKWVKSQLSLLYDQIIALGTQALTQVKPPGSCNP